MTGDATKYSARSALPTGRPSNSSAAAPEQWRRFSLKRPSNSAATWLACVALPPLPNAIALRPASSALAIVSADAAQDFLLYLVADLGVPVAMECPAGHEVPNLTLPLGTMVELVADEQTNWISYTEDALAEAGSA